MKILILDIETTGFLPNGEIVEVGIVELCLCCGSTKILYDKVFNPKASDEELQNSWIVKNGYMTFEEIRAGAKFEDEASAIQAIIDKYPDGLTAYNRPFDVNFMIHYGIRFGKLLPCPMRAATGICKIPAIRGGYKWPSAEEAYKFFFPNSDYIEKHRGADDAIHEAQIVFTLNNMNELKEIQ
jgi:DNA polymerase-3 subunit epsilon